MLFNYHSLPALSTNCANVNVEIVPSGVRKAKGQTKNHVMKIYTCVCVCARICVYVCIYVFLIVNAYVCFRKKYSNNMAAHERKGIVAK